MSELRVNALKVEKYNITSPIENFSAEVDEINLSKELRIRRITAAEKSEYFAALFRGFGKSPYREIDVIAMKFVLETTYYHKEGTTLTKSDCLREFKDVIVAMRLFKTGVLVLNVLCSRQMVLDPPTGPVYSSIGRYLTPIGPEYTLKKSEVKPFKRFWKQYKKFQTDRATTKSNKYLKIALRRFNLGIEEDYYLEDKIIDYLISLEALYLPESRELTYKLSNRVAILIGKEERETEEIRQTIVKAYDLRSQIVHGKMVRPIKINGKIIQPKDFTFNIEEILRKSIRFFIELSKTYKTQKTIIKELDKSLLNVKIRKKLHRLTKSVWFS